MEYFPYQQMPQATYSGIYEDHNNRFQPGADISHLTYTAHRWVDPYARSAMLPSPRTETKPRLSKGEVAQLEAEFQKNNKPSSNVKKALAEQMRVEVARINNWFQNRRAKKKQELKALEQEAKSRAETEAKTSTGSEPAGSCATEEDDNTTPSERSVKDESSPSPSMDDQGAKMRAESQDTSDVSVHEFQGNSHAGFLHSGPHEVPYSDGLLDSTTPANDGYYSSLLPVSSSCPDQTAIATSSAMNGAMGEDSTHINAYAFPLLVYPDNDSGAQSFAHQQEAAGESSAAYPDADTLHPTIETGYEQSEGQGQPGSLLTQPLRLKSPPAIDLAGRRKRPGLALAGLRSISNGPATGIDFGRRGMDPGSPMRRVASATGFGPQGIRRFPGQHRGGLQDRRQEALLQAARSPNMGSPFHSMAPPTPDTPVVASQHTIREETVSSNSSEDDGTYLMYPPELSSQPSTLDMSIRTPPATPLTFGDVFSHSIGTTLGYGNPDDNVMTPSMEGYQVPRNDFCLPPYVSDGYISQPSTPGVVSQMPMAAGYYAPMPNSRNTEYNWSDTSMVSSKSSPNPSQRRQLQFNNFTPQDFNSAK